MRIRTTKKTHEVTVNKDGATGVFQVYPMDPVEHAKLIKRHTSNTIKKGQLVSDPDYMAIKLEKINRTIKGWDLEDEDGGPYECTKENKETAFLLNSDLINEVLDRSDEIGAGIAEVTEVEKKTSPIGSSGTMHPIESPAITE